MGAGPGVADWMGGDLVVFQKRRSGCLVRLARLIREQC
jgi:hypothetical protein